MTPEEIKRIDDIMRSISAKLSDDDVLVCVPVSAHTPFTDNMIGQCMSCGRPVWFRPYAERPKKLCVPCAPAYIAQNGAGSDGR